jgi:hypothetical protein
VEILQAMMATADLHAPAEAATRILPALAPLTIDPIAEVRQTALQALADFSQVLKNNSKLLDEQASAAGPPYLPSFTNHLTAGFTWLAFSNLPTYTTPACQAKFSQLLVCHLLIVSAHTSMAVAIARFLQWLTRSCM